MKEETRKRKEKEAERQFFEALRAEEAAAEKEEHSTEEIEHHELKHEYSPFDVLEENGIDVKDFRGSVIDLQDRKDVIKVKIRPKRYFVKKQFAKPGEKVMPGKEVIIYYYKSGENSSHSVTCKMKGRGGIQTRHLGGDGTPIVTAAGMAAQWWSGRMDFEDLTTDLSYWI